MTQPTQIEAVLEDFTDELTAQQRRYIIDQICRITDAAQTQPTQAQIEADLIFRLRQWRSNPFPETHLADIFSCMDEAATALTAAAQVGDIEWARENLKDVRQQSCGLDPLTIERCSQVVWDIEIEGGLAIGTRGEIVAAIRALKDEA